MKVPNMEPKSVPPDYQVGDIIRRQQGSGLDHYGVLIGWDNWLRPIVFRINREVGGLHFDVLSLVEFEAGNGSELVRRVRAGELAPDAHDAAPANVMWGRIRKFLNGRARGGSSDSSCEEIARILVTGEAFSSRNRYRHIAVAA